MPILKPSRSHSDGVGGANSFRRPRLDPTMISAPLGDFRHTMHVGRGGDAFGDTSFLSNHGPAPKSTPPVPDPVHQPGKAAMTTTTNNNNNDRGNNGNSYDSTTPSMAAGSYAASMEAGRAVDSPNMAASGYSNGPSHPPLKHSESISSFSLDLDLGPSMLGEVLGVMERDDQVDTWAGLIGKEAGLELGGKTKWEGTGGKGEGVQGNGEGGGGGERSRAEIGSVRETDSTNGIPSSQDDTPCESQDHTPRNGSHASLVSSEYEGVSEGERERERQPKLGGGEMLRASLHKKPPLDLSDSEEEEDGQGYVFEDDFDDEIGL
ncbi:Cdc42 effector protein 1 [Acipenser ruthenus]|uniref:Cdc42 effector protein 1 n=1 Tax=Acipenser ruthenus TaxID=7906 RepID=A0A444UTQ7_ACIRT|nr:Cdc42 effector protein 1 [Acipenser ruthenus]